MRFEAQIEIQIYLSGQATTVDCSLYVRSLGSINPDTMVGERSQKPYRSAPFFLPHLFRTIKSTSISDRGGLTKD